MILNDSASTIAANKLSASTLSVSATESLKLTPTNGTRNPPSPSVILSLSSNSAGMINETGQQSSSADRISPVYAKPEVVFSENEDQEASSSGTTEASADYTGILSEQELQIVEELKARDREVRAHEQAHKAVGGQYAGAISLSYQAGPDGRRYAVGGEVPIDVSPVPGDPQATIAKMTIVRAAATAPAQPSSQDIMVAAEASRKLMEAQNELMLESREQLKTSENSTENQSETGVTDEKLDVQAPVTNNNSDSRLEVFQSISGIGVESETKVDILI